MASVIEICNLALAHLGDTATVASIDPPEGSAQAEHCATFYPIARDAMLELHNWKFATRRAQLAQLDVETWSWSYAYAKPADALKIISVLPVGAGSDAESADHEFECSADGTPLILSNAEDASLRYIALVTDTTMFSPLFTMALSWQLASMLAGPILKGDVGAAEAKRCLATAQGFLTRAAVEDANQRKVTPVHTPAWMADR
jgi:hypothetical protein